MTLGMKNAAQVRRTACTPVDHGVCENGKRSRRFSSLALVSGTVRPPVCLAAAIKVAIVYCGRGQRQQEGREKS